MSYISNIEKSNNIYPPILDSNGCNGNCESCPTPTYNECQAYETEYQEDYMVELKS